MKQKRQYETPDIEILTFEAEDILTTSGTGDDIKNTGIELPDHNW